MSQVEKEDKSYSVEDQLPSKDINFGSSRVVFSHQATLGDKSIDLSNLVAPTDMLSNGFVQALSGEISAAHLSVLRNNLTLISTRGPLTQYLDYVVSDAGTINFLPTSVLGVDGALDGEIFTGVIDTKKANAIVVGDVKEYDITLDDTNFTPGDTILNLGVKYKVNENPLNQTGEYRAYKNGKRIYRNKGNAPASPLADGNFHEPDAGTGEGTTIELNEPAQAGDIFGFDFGLKISKGDIQIFEALERLQGSFLKLATDAAPGLGNPLSNYFTANPSEIERRAFGDLVLGVQSQLNALEALRIEPEIKAVLQNPQAAASSDTWVDASATLSEISIQLDPGIYNLITYGSIVMDAVSSTTSFAANVGVFDNNDVLVPELVSMVFGRLNDAGGSSGMEIVAMPFNMQKQITVTETTTYRLRVRQSPSGAFMTTRLTAEDDAGGLTGNDSATVIKAKKIANL